jgi:hypothetical protein
LPNTNVAICARDDNSTHGLLVSLNSTNARTTSSVLKAGRSIS